MSIKFLTLPNKEEERAQKLTQDNSETLWVVYKPSERNSDFYEYHCLWDSETEYPDDCVAVSIGSVYGGKQFFPAGTCFANVEGSTKDPKPDNLRSWRKVMQDYKLSNYTTCCAELNTIYLSSDKNVVEGFRCTNRGEEYIDRSDISNSIWIHGAHVLMGAQSSSTVVKGSSVYLLPLCAAHNTYDNITGKFGTGYFMKLKRRQEVMKLNNFIPSENICEAIRLKESMAVAAIDDEPSAEKPQLAIGLDFTFMGVDLSSYYKKTSDGYEIFLAPSNIDNNVTLTIKEIVEQFNKMAGDGAIKQEDIEGKIAGSENVNLAEDINFDSIRFCLKMLFLNIKSSGGKTTAEYALSLQIIADDLIPKEIQIFNIKCLSFNIWNTKRQNVLDKMALTTPESF